MPLLSRDQIIKEYYEEVKVKYPHITYEQCQDICKLPFDGIAEWIKSGLFPHIMVQYLGKILVNERRLTSTINKLHDKYLHNKIDEAYYVRKLAELTEHLSEVRQLTNKEVKRKKAKDSKNYIIVDDDIQTSNQADNQGG